MTKFLLLCLLAMPLVACIAFDPDNAAGRPSTAIRMAREVCSTAWAKPVPDETHWGAVLVAGNWRVWLRDHGGTPNCSLAMVTINKSNGAASDCQVCPSF